MLAGLRDCRSDISVKLKESRLPDNFTPHLHTEYEIYYGISGGNGFFINEKYYACRPRDMFIIQKMKVHKITVSEPDNYSRCVISIDSAAIEKIRSILPDSSAVDFLDSAGVCLPVKVHLSESSHKEFIILINEYLQLEDNGEHLLLAAKLFEILAFIKRLFTSGKDVSAEEIQPETRIDTAVYYIEKNFRICQPSDVAAALNVSENYIRRMFKNETGVSINNYIIQRKIAEAKKLLYCGANVKEACSGAGFGDCSNFIRTFRKVTGTPPGVLKRSLGAESVYKNA